MPQRRRVAAGGVEIDRESVVRFDFDGIRYEGHAGDTLASALLANGVRTVGRSFKYHRPRGVVGIGSEEPNALVRLGLGAYAEPNLKATEIDLLNGQIARSQNRWPSLTVDAGAVANLLSRFLPAGFYYKTFMGPPGGWPTWERYIRRMAGLGQVPEGRDPDGYAKRHAHCEVLVVGGGPTGLVAALAAARTGARVILADENRTFGGGLLQAPGKIEGRPAREWIAAIVDKLAELDNVTLLPRATVTGYYDHELLTVVERVTDHLAAPDPRLPRQRIWMVRARQVVLATGAIERPQIFPGNDLPGVMMTRAIRGYLHRFGVLCGRSIVLCASDDSAYYAAAELRRAGASIPAIVDSRDPPGERALALARSENIPVLAGHIPTLARGMRRVRSLEVSRLEADGREVSGLVERFACDAVGMSGGWTPAVHLFSQARGKLRYDPMLAAFVPGETAAANRSAGACNGELRLRACLWQGFEAGAGAAADAGATVITAPPRRLVRPDPEAVPAPVVWTAPARGSRKRFVDFQNDVTVDDVSLAAREGYRSVEHLKRYTTLGMGTDQGKLSNMHGLALLSDALGAPPASVGTTTFRPPYVPVTMGAMAAGRGAAADRAIRRTAVHDWHESRDALFTNVQRWKHPRLYPGPGENDRQSVRREVFAARQAVGLTDLGTRGALELKGADAAAFLDRVVANDIDDLAVGTVRETLMLREDGMVFETGMVVRLGADRFLLTGSGDPEILFEHVSYLRETVWPELRLFITDVSEARFAGGLTGPAAWRVLASLSEDVEPDAAAIPSGTIRDIVIAGTPARLTRCGIAGEFDFRIDVAADYAMGLWSAIVSAGGNCGLEVCGTQAADIIRIEAGRVALGAEADGLMAPDDLGLGRLVSRNKDFVGARSLRLPALLETGRLQLVGLMTESAGIEIPPGAHVVEEDNRGRPQPSLGHVTSRAESFTLGRYIGLALVRNGRARLGETLYATAPLVNATVPVSVIEPRFDDGEAANG